MVHRFTSKLATGTGDTIRVGQVPVPIHDEECAREFVCELIASVHPKHEIRREVCAPRARVGEIIFGVQRIITDETAEDSALQGEPFADRRKIRYVRRAEVSEPVGARKVGCCSRESKHLRVFAGLQRQLGAHGRAFRGRLPEVNCPHVYVLFIHVESGTAASEQVIRWVVEVIQVTEIQEPTILPP